MKNIKAIAFVAIATLSSPSLAFTDGSGWQIVAQLTTLLKTANEQLKTAKETMDVGKKMEEFEAVKAVKDVSSLGNDLNALFKEMDNTVELFSYDEDMGLGDVRAEFDSLVDQYKSIRGEEDMLKMLKGYAGLLESIENLSTLRDYHSAQLQAMSTGGMNEGDAAKQSAYTGSLQTQLLIERSLQDQTNEAKRTKRAIGEANYLRNIGGVYGALADDSKGEE